MSRYATPQLLQQALNERLGAGAAAELDQRTTLVFGSGQSVTIVFDDNQSTVTITAPVAHARDNLPAEALRHLLTLNGPAAPLAGGLLRVRPGQDFLEVHNALPLALGAVGIANIILRTANAAHELSERMRQHAVDALA